MTEIITIVAHQMIITSAIQRITGFAIMLNYHPAELLCIIYMYDAIIISSYIDVRIKQQLI
jgi:hypothetical protein